MIKTCIVIGASHAASQFVSSLRREGWTDRILVIGDESSFPYHRPPLSKEYLAGEKSLADLQIKHPDFYGKMGVEFKLGVRVDSVDRSEKTVLLDSGETLTYDKLAFCTGARTRKIPLPGSDLPGVNYLRSYTDIENIRANVVAGKSAVIIGGGYIGLETSAVLNKLGMKVTVLEAAPRVLARVTAPEISSFYTRVHIEEGVSIKTAVNVKALEGRGQVEHVLLEDGTAFAASLVVIGVGVMPNVELAEAAGLDIDNGIVVDECSRTKDPDIVAMGDCASFPSLIYGRRIRLESVPNATDQAKSAAASVCGKPRVYDVLPWFWSDQYDLKLQIAGLNQGYDQVIVRKNPTEDRSLVALYLQDGKLIAADCINSPREFMQCKRIIRDGLSANAAIINNPDSPLSEIFPKELEET